MIILTIRTDKTEAEIGLYDDTERRAYKRWQAHRELAETLNKTIVEVLQSQHVLLHELQGIVVFKGPGSFTGLRIGCAVANALAYGLHIPIVSAMADDWIDSGIAQLLGGQDERVALPEYGAAPNITAPKH